MVDTVRFVTPTARESPDMVKTLSTKAALFLGMTALVGGLFSFYRDNTDPAPRAQAAGARPHGITQRQPWTTSRVVGSPDPPLPYRIERVFPKLQFYNPLVVTDAPGTDRLFVGEQAGRIYSFPNDPNCGKADLFLDLAKDVHSWDPKGKVKRLEALYGLTFHPQFAKNRYCYICYVLESKKPGEQLPDGSRVSRFRVSDTDPPRCLPETETVLLTFLAGGHNGGCLKFGPDGCLYISTGYATNPTPPDLFDTGQDISDLLSSILRIDVDHADQGKPYRVPPDNPFLKTPKARPEVWAYGFRNPWKMSFDRVSGDLWVGDVGWELWEMVYRVQRGGNYGWSVMEGRQPVRPDSKRGPTPIRPPALDFPHSEAASITGGFVYRGQRYKDLYGCYICGDWVTRKLWGTKFDGDKIVTHRELAQGTQRIVDFAEDHAGELYLLDYDEKGGLYQLAPNDVSRYKPENFPRKLSETGLFADTSRHVPAAGVAPFAVNAEQWADFATAERFVALPGTSTVTIHDEPINLPGTFFSAKVFFPKDGVLAKTVSLEMERGRPESRRQLETQILHYDGTAWRGYTYRWNDAQTDATLVPAAGAEQTFTVRDPHAPGGSRKQTWRFHSRAECLTCHNPWGGPTLAFTEAQLDREHRYGSVTDNQLRALEHAGIVALATRDKSARRSRQRPVPLTNPHDPAAALDARARSYLHVNCSHCHEFGAGGTADLQLRYDAPLERMKVLEVRPIQGTFDIPAAQILAPGDPYRSVVYFRMAKLGRGRMPHLGSEIIDERGLRLVHDWIRQLPIRKDERALLEQVRTRGTQARAEAVNKLLSSTSGALMLARALGEGRIAGSARKQVLDAALARPEAQVRDLFERFLPDDQRVKRLGTTIRPEMLLALKGDAARGKALFFNAATQCKNCHRVQGEGSTLGPDLSQIAKKYTRAQLLESLLEPSKFIDPKYAAYLVETADGQAHTGVLVERNAKEVVLRDARDQAIRIPAGKVSTLAPQKASLMPEQLLRDLTVEQAADLLAYLASLK
jgi:putative heme-binding domain-containing protein